MKAEGQEGQWLLMSKDQENSQTNTSQLVSYVVGTNKVELQQVNSEPAVELAEDHQYVLNPPNTNQAMTVEGPVMQISEIEASEIQGMVGDIVTVATGDSAGYQQFSIGNDGQVIVAADSYHGDVQEAVAQEVTMETTNVIEEAVLAANITTS